MSDFAPAQALLCWRGDEALSSALDRQLRQRAIGVVYRPQTELHSHYFEAHLGSQFDAYVWFKETTAITPLPGAPPEGAPDIYPFGV